MTSRKYSDYFAIDPSFIACVTSEAMTNGSVSWKDFYPHETFVKLLEQVIRVMRHEDNQSIWIQGAYGSGKSYAVLTVRALLGADDDEVRDYFKKYSSILRPELLQALMTARHAGKWIVAYRSTSSDIKNDDELFMALHQCIEEAIQNCGNPGMVYTSQAEAAASWLEEKSARREYFSKLMETCTPEDYKGSATDADEILEDLRSDDNERISSAMKIVTAVGKKENMLFLHLTSDSVTRWISEVITQNNLGGIIFIWDEFTDFLKLNAGALSNFQKLAEIGTNPATPFYLMIVAHERDNLISTHGIARNIRDRFADIKIDLPDNMALRIIAAAMKFTKDDILIKEWMERRSSLAEDLRPVIEKIGSCINSGRQTSKKEEELKKDLENVIPIHPYAALVLKHISVLFGSNQRSIFEFIIHKYDDAMDFKWFIQNHGACDDNNLLTTDMLWDFFYVRCQSSIQEQIRRILDAYRFNEAKLGNPDEKRILIVLLLLEAISTVESDIQLLRPSKENIKFAFGGLDNWSSGKADTLIESLVSNKILFRKTLAKGGEEFTIANIAGDDNEQISEWRRKLAESLTTKDLINDDGAGIANLFKEGTPYVQAWFSFRFTFSYLAGLNLEKDYDAWIESPIQKIKVLVGLAKDQKEKAKLYQFMQEKGRQINGDYILIDASSTILGEARYKDYLDRKTHSCFYLSEGDHKRAEDFGKAAIECLKEWKENIANGEFIIYTQEHNEGIHLSGKAKICEVLEEIDHKKYPYGPENMSLTDSMFKDNKMSQGIKYGCNESIENRNEYNFPQNRKSLPELLNGLWGVPEYWKNDAVKSHPVTSLKIKIDKIVESEFAKNGGNASISKIYKELSKPPFGLLPNNISAFLLGFVLKEYTHGKYYGSASGSSTPLDSDRLANLLGEVLKAQKQSKAKGIASTRADENYIVQMSPEHLEFLNGTATIFHLDRQECDSVNAATLKIRTAMKSFSFPIWTLEYLPSVQTNRNTEENAIVPTLLKLYCDIANTSNSAGLSEGQCAYEIGKLLISSKANGVDIVSELTDLMTSRNTEDGMRQYVLSYRNGELAGLAQEIEAGSSYLDDLKKRFNSDDANWVWDLSTANERIDTVILDYQIIKESSSILSNTRRLEDCLSNWKRRLRQIKIPFDGLMEQNVPGIYPLLKILSEIQQRGDLPEKDKERFYNLIREHKSEFANFCNDIDLQIVVFKEKYKSFIEDMNDEELKSFIDTIPEGQFGKSTSDYNNFVNQKLSEFRKKQAKNQITELWQKYTKTRNPRDWSKKNRTPILCMFDDTQRENARKMFASFDGDPQDSEAKKVCSFLNELEQQNFYEILNDSSEQDRRLMDYFAKDYQIVITDPESVREELEKADSDANSWMNAEGQKRIDTLADRLYKVSGISKAVEKISNMSDKELREYVKQMLSNNSRFGMEILRQK